MVARSGPGPIQSGRRPVRSHRLPLCYPTALSSSAGSKVLAARPEVGFLNLDHLADGAVRHRGDEQPLTVSLGTSVLGLR